MKIVKALLLYSFSKGSVTGNRLVCDGGFTQYGPYEVNLDSWESSEEVTLNFYYKCDDVPWWKFWVKDFEVREAENIHRITTKRSDVFYCKYSLSELLDISNKQENI